MKNWKSVTALCVLTTVSLTAPVWAVDEHHPDQKPAAASQPPVQQMKENADKLRAQVDKIDKTKDPVERQKLMQEHMQTLRASMMMAAGKGPGGGEAGMKGGGMMHDCPMMSGSGENMMQRMQHMEERMNHMQQMLEQQQGKPPAAKK